MKIASSRAFTLIELMITLTVAAIVLTLGVPSFREMIQNNRLVTQANDLATAINLARSEAVKRGTNVTICKRNSAGTACDNAANWHDGWLVFTDSDDDGVIDDDGDANLCEAGEDDDCILRVHAPLSGGNTLSKNGSSPRVTFDSRGYAGGFNCTFTLCDSRGAGHARGKVLSRPGRLRNSTDPLTCP